MNIEQLALRLNDCTFVTIHRPLFPTTKRTSGVADLYNCPCYSPMELCAKFAICFSVADRSFLISLRNSSTKSPFPHRRLLSLFPSLPFPVCYRPLLFLTAPFPSFPLRLLLIPLSVFPTAPSPSPHHPFSPCHLFSRSFPFQSHPLSAAPLFHGHPHSTATPFPRPPPFHGHPVSSCHFYSTATLFPRPTPFPYATPFLRTTSFPPSL